MDETIKREKKKWLSRYTRNRVVIQRLEEKVASLDSKMKTIKTSNLSGMPRGGQPVTSADIVADKLELESRIEKLELKGRQYRREILDAIDDLEDAVHAEILESVFIDGMLIEDVGDELGYNIRHVYRLYARAIEAIQVPDTGDSN